MRKFNKFTMAKLHQQKDLIYCKNCDQQCINLQQNKFCNPKTILTEIQGKNPKIAPNFTGPGEIIDINDTDAKLKINYKIKCLMLTN